MQYVVIIFILGEANLDVAVVELGKRHGGSCLLEWSAKCEMVLVMFRSNSPLVGEVDISTVVARSVVQCSPVQMTRLVIT